MAGSLNHMIAEDGSFDFDLIENMGDAHEACEECFDIIAALLELMPNADAALKAACARANAPEPAAVPRFGTRRPER
jgi:hypothetical protein